MYVPQYVNFKNGQKIGKRKHTKNNQSRRAQPRRHNSNIHHPRPQMERAAKGGCSQSREETYYSRLEEIRLACKIKT